MIKIPYEKMIETISKKSNLPSAEIEAKIDAKLKQLSGLITKDGAAHIIANELGIKLDSTPEGNIKVKDLMPGMRNIEVLAKVTAVYEVREFQKNNRTGKVGSFIAGDETGTIRFVCWGSKADQIKTLNQNDVIMVKSGYIRENNSNKEVHLNDMAELSINPPGKTVEVNAISIDRGETVRKKISEISENDSNIEVMGHIVQMFDPKFYEICPECSKRMRQEDGTFTCLEHGAIVPDYGYVLNFVLDDGTDNIRVVAFRNQVDSLIEKTKEQVLEFRLNPESFAQIKNNLLGNLILIKGRATKNAMFDRTEIICQNINIKPDPEKELSSLQTEEVV